MPAARTRRSVHVRRVWAGAAVVALIAADVWMAAVSATGDARPAAVSMPIDPGAGSSAAAIVPDAGMRSAPGTGADGKAGPVRKRDPKPTVTAASPPVVVARGNARFTVLRVPADGTVTPTKIGSRRVVRYTVETEGGLGVDRAGYAAKVATVLTDARGWQTKDRVRFINVSPGAAAKGARTDLRIRLTSPATTDRLCAPLQTRGRVSCHNGSNVVLNARRWLLGVDAYGKDINSYRTYLINHEVGHGLGHGHAGCPGAGKDAPVMMQQTYGVKGCKPWPWPTPRKGA